MKSQFLSSRRQAIYRQMQKFNNCVSILWSIVQFVARVCEKFRVDSLPSRMKIAFGRLATIIGVLGAQCRQGTRSMPSFTLSSVVDELFLNALVDDSQGFVTTPFSGPRADRKSHQSDQKAAH
jgi:hypothetical protein